MKQLLTIIPMIVTGFLLAGCGPESGSTSSSTATNQTTVQDVKREMGEAVSAAKDLAGQKKDELIAGYDTNLAKIDEDLGAMTKKMDDLQGEAKTRAQAAIASLKEQRDAVGRELAKLKDSTGDAWTKISEGMSASLDKLKTGINNAKREFN